jgi:ribokinase
VALIFVAADGENSIGVASGANAQLTPADVEAAAEVIASADVLVVQLETPLETVDRATAIAAGHGVRVILNPAPAQPLDQAVRLAAAAAALSVTKLGEQPSAPSRQAIEDLLASA